MSASPTEEKDASLFLVPFVSQETWVSGVKNWFSHQSAQWLGTGEVVSKANQAVAQLEALIEKHRQNLSEAEVATLREVRDEYIELRHEVHEDCLRLETTYELMARGQPAQLLARIKTHEDRDLVQGHATKAKDLTLKIQLLLDQLKDKLKDTPIWQFLCIFFGAVALVAAIALTGGLIAIAVGPTIVSTHLLVGAGGAAAVSGMIALIAKLKQGGSVEEIITELTKIQLRCQQILAALRGLKVNLEVYSGEMVSDMPEFKLLLQSIAKLRGTVEFK